MKTASLTVLHERQQHGDRPCGVYGGCVNVMYPYGACMRWLRCSLMLSGTFILHEDE
jgi:hypothetical protein